MTLVKTTALATAAALPLLGMPPSARAALAPAREALVIGNGTYTSLPPMPACLLSAHAVAAALRNAGFNVVEREDATSGATDAALGEAGRYLTDSPGAISFVYVCGYATSFNDRPFLLPVSANLGRPADALTQGVLAKSLLDMLRRGGAQSAVVALDLVPAGDAPAALGIDAALRPNLPDGAGLIAISQPKPSDAPTPLAASLVANLKPSVVQIAPFLTALQQQLGGSKSLTIAAVQVPANPAYLVGAAEPPAVAPPPPQAAAPPTQPAQAPPQAAPLPAEEQMTDTDRRRVQTALARLGYYDGKVDGKFGADTRAAIRRYQHELGIAMTGKLTAEQANKLVGR